MIEKYKKRYYALRAVEGGEYATKLLDTLLINYSVPYEINGEVKRIFAVPNTAELMCYYVHYYFVFGDMYQVARALLLLNNYHLCQWDTKLGALVMPSIYEDDRYERDYCFE